MNREPRTAVGRDRGDGAGGAPRSRPEPDPAPDHRARPTRWWQHLLAVAGWAATAAAVLGLALHFGVSERRAAVLLASFASYLLLGAVLGLVFLALARRVRAAAIAAAVAAAAAWTQLPMFVPDRAAGDGPPLTVLTSNLLFGEADTAFVTDLVRQHRVDVLTVQELTVDAAVRLDAAGLAAELPHRYLHPGAGGGGTGIYSRYPLRDGRRLDGFELANLGATVDHPEAGPVTVFALHPVPPPLGFAAWRSEMATLRELLAATPVPAVVGADFNATRDHVAYRDLLTGPWADAAELAGAGPQLTYPADRSWGPLIGIDHVLVAGGSAESVRGIDVPGSDHRAVLARIRLPG